MSAKFSVPVPGIGDFTFRRRSFRDGIKIQAEYEALTGGLDEPSDNLHLIASAWSAIKVLLVEAPASFNLEALDPDDDEAYARLVRVGAALFEKESSFRRPAAQAGAAARPAAGGDDGLRVSAPVQPAAD